MDDSFSRDTDEHMEKSLNALRRELANIRTGRANPAIIEHLAIDYYGSPTPLQQLANITAPDARQLLVQPYDRSALRSIEKAIRTSDFGFNPTNDGTTIRIVIPQLTEERRRDFVKLVHKRVEEAKVAVRNVRREANDTLKKQRKDKELSEDDEKRALDALQKITDRAIREADAIGQAKETEIMEI
jgi:ribosome recycling factor